MASLARRDNALRRIGACIAGPASVAQRGIKRHRPVTSEMKAEEGRRKFRVKLKRWPENSLLRLSGDAAEEWR